MSQDFRFEEDDTRDLRMYFLTNRRFYELAYTWVNTRDELGRVQPKEEWKPQFISPLKELPLRGGEVMKMVEHVNRSQAVVISLSSSTAEELTVNASISVEASDGKVPAPLVFLLPFHAASESQQEEEEQQDQLFSDALGKAQQLPPHSISVKREQREQLYQLVAVSSEGSIEPIACLPYRESLVKARSLEQDKGTLIFRYYNEPMLPPGKKRDSLEWLNPSYVRRQEPRGFFFQGLYFESTNVVEIEGEQGPELVPAEIYLATAFQLEREGSREREVSIYRPFGRRGDALEWLSKTEHVKASLTRLVPDPGSTNWFVLSDMQNLNPLGFRQEGAAEWIY